MENDLVYFGGEVKLLDSSGRVGGYLVRFSDVNNRDLSGDWFDAKSYLGPVDGAGQECLYEHGYPVIPEGKRIDQATVIALKSLADRTFSPLKVKRDAIGIFAETVLDIEDEYEKFIHGRVKAGKVGWSSAAAGHRVKREANGYLSRWPIAEGSLTPRPCEPLNRAVPMKSLANLKFVSLSDEDVAEETPVVSVKSLASRLNQCIEDRIEDGHERADTVKCLAQECVMNVEQVEDILSGKTVPSNGNLKAFARVLKAPFERLKALRVERRSIKEMFTEALAENTPSSWQLDSAFRDVCRDLAMGAKGTAAAGAEFDFKAPLHEAVVAYITALEGLTSNQIQEYIDSSEDEPFYLKSIVNFTEELVASTSLEVDEHCSLAESAFKSVVARFRQFHGTRVKAGRVLSEKMRGRIKTLRDQMSTLVTDCDTILEQTKPMADDMAKNAALVRNLVLRQERKQQLGA